ncbi:response regulator transcription factor [Clostridioides difficile]|uniref:response regulator transcription factor n=1 Tax=Clostridioides difficile TaxID=1496 RepID=UPI00097FF1B9|nr:response regulator transcription factor [Clostridioides difficile]MDF3815394.1 response regulator transcription factor [Clostridioides difficile]SJO48300.1 Staphylococcal respiratory response protein A [Clostridioides difficile]HBF4255116.1 response regulator transcription factor [Clostridioides difficile]HBF4284684.1 response regulator transcription factor [Clostridioides difficile]HBF5047730.1 response regulator transcription factor [Clostridioides difficile]
MAKILVVEDEKRMQSIIVEYMQKGGYTCITADDGVEALTILKSNNVDLMILDIMMPYLDGFSVCRVSREMTNIPIIILTAKGEEEDKLKGYEYGADDYITKPFSPKVLLAKVNALLRRYTTDIPKNSLSLGKIFIMVASRQVYVEDKLIDLTYKEFELLRLFMENPNQVFSREKLLNCIWGYDFEGNTRTVDTHIKTLRKKLGSEGHHIVTLIRSGYKFEVKE